MKRYLIYSLFCLFICSCSTSTRQYDGLENFFQEKVNVKTQPAFAEINQQIKNPLLFSISDNKLVVLEFQEDTLILLQDRNSNNITKIIPKGQGPVEMVEIQDIDYDNHYFYFLSFKQHKVLKYDENQNIILEDTLISNGFSKYLCSTSLAIDSSLIFYPILKNDNRFLIKNKTSEEIQFGQIESQDGFNSESLGTILQGRLLLNKTTKRLFWCSFMGHAYEIYDYSNVNNIKLIFQNIYKLPYVVTGESDATLANDATYCSSSITTNNNFIYVLYSGNSVMDLINQAIKQEAFYDSKKILVFDWDGNPIKQLNVDHEIRCIRFDNKDQKLYGIELNDDSEYSFCEIPLE